MLTGVGATMFVLVLLCLVFVVNRATREQDRIREACRETAAEKTARWAKDDISLVRIVD